MQSTYQSVPFDFLPGSKWKRFLSVQNIYCICNSRAVHFKFRQTLTLIKKENQYFLIYKEILSGAVAKSHMWKGLLIYEEMRKYFPIFEALLVIYDCNCSTQNFLIYAENFIFFFISVLNRQKNRQFTTSGNLRLK